MYVCVVVINSTIIHPRESNVVAYMAGAAWRGGEGSDLQREGFKVMCTTFMPMPVTPRSQSIVTKSKIILVVLSLTSSYNLCIENIFI